MLRAFIVLGIILVGSFYAIQGSFYALLLYLWVAYFRPESWVWGGFASALSRLSFYAGVFLVLSSVLRGAKFKFDLRAGLLFAIFTQSLLSTIFSEQYAYSWGYFQDFAKSMIISYLIMCLLDDTAKLRLALVVITASLGFEMVKQGWVELILHPGEKNFNVSVFLGDNNGVAMAALMLVPVIGALARTATTRWHRPVLGFAAIGIVYRAITTYSRGAFVSCGVLILIMLIRSKHRLRTALAIAAVCLIVLPVLPQAFWDRMNTVAISEDRLDENDDSSRSRLHFWRVAVEMANEHPLLGVGHNAYNPNFDRYDFLYGRYGLGRAVHSTWFGTLSELGYPGLFLLLANLLAAFYGLYRVRKAAARGEVAPELGIYASALESSLIVFCVGGTFLSAQYVEMAWHFIALSAAVVSIASVAAGVKVEETPALPAQARPAHWAYVPPAAAANRLNRTGQR